MDLSKYVKDTPIPIMERITGAFTVFFTNICQGVLSILLAPVVFVKTLFQSTTPMIDIRAAIEENPKLFGRASAGHSLGQLPREGDWWKQQHDELYGGEDEVT